AVRTFSINAGLAASTVTPGSTAPDVSRTTPAMPLACCADAADGSASAKPSASMSEPDTQNRFQCMASPRKERSGHRGRKRGFKTVRTSVDVTGLQTFELQDE